MLNTALDNHPDLPKFSAKFSMDTNNELPPPLPQEPDKRHFRESSYREMIVETLFLGQLLQYLWENKAPTAEVLYSMRDNGGYDLAIECNSVARFIQLKGMTRSKAVRVNARLAQRVGGCVICVFIDEKTLNIRGYRWLGDIGGSGGLAPENFKPARKLLYNANAKKALLTDTRIIPSSKFTTVTSIAELVENLFGIKPYN